MESDGLPPTLTPTPKQMATRFQPGQSGNPQGSRAKCRFKLSEAFIKQLWLDFEAHGAQAIVNVRERRPQDYLRIIASLIPRQEANESGGNFIIGAVHFSRNYDEPVPERTRLSGPDGADAGPGGRGPDETACSP
jgi:hypothetical protein